VVTVKSIVNILLKTIIIIMKLKEWNLKML